MLAAVVNYGIGNLFSVRKGLERAGFRVVITSDAETIKRSDLIVLPGVGSHKAAMRHMENAKLIDVIKDSDAFKFGICLGMQLLYERSEEGGLTGLGLLKGEIVRLRGVPRVPHMGWNMVESEDVELFDGIEKEYFYFAHSYYKPYEGAPWEVAHTSYGNVTITAAVCRGKVCGTQFHPEKSHRPGATVLRNLFNMLKR